MKNASPRNSTQTDMDQQSVSQRDDGNMVQRIRERVYELYEERGRRNGHQEEDWLQAEEEIWSAHSFHKAA